MRRWQCRFCSHIFDESLGDPENGIQPGTAFENVPDSWFCPDCGASKDEYDLIED